jgi:transposase-like protein
MGVSKSEQLVYKGVMSQCPHCRDTENQIKSGLNRTGSQRFACKLCQRTYTPEPNPLGYTDDVRKQALRLYIEGNSFRRIARLLAVNHQSVINWINAFHKQLPKKKAPARVDVAELDEMFTFVGNKKKRHTS